ncbi:MAG: LPS-assembly protein LptD [Caldisericaceae bacterium]|nr:LPS-assembly protein LptD [Caldisericaceae bacterium]
MKFRLIPIVLTLLLFQLSGSQPSMADTTSKAAPDTLTADSKTQQTSDSELKGPIKYQADFIALSDSGNVIELIGHAQLNYLQMELKAAYIRLNQRQKLLFACGLADSISPDSANVVIGKPIFKDRGQEPITGDQIEYNFETKRGKVIMGRTQMEPGFYRGSRIHRIADSTLLVQDGIFTSCEYIDNPHFYFQSQKIRVKVKDKIVARPIIFYIADIPLAWFPFGVFPNKRGRRSGIVVPKYGEGASTGRFLRSFGYYWAPNDYFDAAILMDFYDKIGFAYRTNLRYNVRYKLNGRFNGEYFPRDPTTGKSVERWRFRFNHRQVIDPTMSIAGSGSFSSDKQFARQLSPYQRDRLNQNITSHLTFSKRWKKSQISLTVNASRNENLQTGNISYTLPNVNLNFPQKTLYEIFSGKKLGAQRKWYQNIYFNLSSQMVHRGSKVLQSDSTFKRSSTQGVHHRMGLSTSTKIFRYFNLSPNISLTEDWVDEIVTAEYDQDTKTIVEKKKKQFAARHTFSTGIGLKTTLYGLFEPNIGSLKFIRHKLDPSISFRYTPDFSSPFFGYFTRIDTGGVVQKIDKFKNSPYGGTPTSRSQSMSISVNNFFQGKLIDKEGKEKKIDILTANFSTRYNFLADSLKWSDISGNFRTRIWGRSFSFRTIHSLYQLNSKNQKINKFNKIPQLMYLNTSFNFRLTEKTFQRKKKKENDKEASADSLQKQLAKEGILETQTIQYEEEDYINQAKKVNIPWSVSFNLNYTYDRRRAPADRHRFGLSSNASLQLTKNWKISWNAIFDVKNRKIASQNFSIYRDLHCWEMSFNWQPEIGYYFFQINVKASALQDIKVTKRRATRFSGYY